jgi:hypothetical protein
VICLYNNATMRVCRSIVCECKEMTELCVISVENKTKKGNFFYFKSRLTHIRTRLVHCNRSCNVIAIPKQ